MCPMSFPIGLPTRYWYASRAGIAFQKILIKMVGVHQVWRCVIIYRDFGALSGRIVLVITGLMQLTSYGESRCYLGYIEVILANVVLRVVLGIFFLLQVSSLSSSPYFNAGHPINWTSPYFFVSLAINIVVTLLIVIRLLLYRRTMVRLLGPGHATECTTVVAMLVESAAVYATFSLLFLIPFTMQNVVSYTFLQVLGEAQVSRAIANSLPHFTLNFVLHSDFSRSWYTSS